MLISISRFYAEVTNGRGGNYKTILPRLEKWGVPYKHGDDVPRTQAVDSGYIVPAKKQWERDEAEKAARNAPKPPRTPKAPRAPKAPTVNHAQADMFAVTANTEALIELREAIKLMTQELTQLRLMRQNGKASS